MGNAEVSATVVRAPELEMMEYAVGAMPMRVDRLSALPGGVIVTRHAAHDISIVTGRTPVPIYSEGEVDQDSLLLALQLSDGDGRWNGQPFARDRIWCYPPGTEHWGIASVTPWWAAIGLSRSAAERLGLGRLAELLEA
jgi:hypothetical protein